MNNSELAIEKILLKEPHLSRAEAIKLLGMKRQKKRNKRLLFNKRSEAQKRRHKGKAPRSSIFSVNGGRVSPR